MCCKIQPTEVKEAMHEFIHGVSLTLDRNKFVFESLTAVCDVLNRFRRPPLFPMSLDIFMGFLRIIHRILIHRITPYSQSIVKVAFDALILLHDNVLPNIDSERFRFFFNAFEHFSANASVALCRSMLTMAVTIVEHHPVFADIFLTPVIFDYINSILLTSSLASTAAHTIGTLASVVPGDHVNVAVDETLHDCLAAVANGFTPDIIPDETGLPYVAAAQYVSCAFNNAVFGGRSGREAAAINLSLMESGVFYHLEEECRILAVRIFVTLICTVEHYHLLLMLQMLTKACDVLGDGFFHAVDDSMTGFGRDTLMEVMVRRVARETYSARVSQSIVDSNFIVPCPLDEEGEMEGIEDLIVAQFGIHDRDGAGNPRSRRHIVREYLLTSSF